MDVGKVMKIEEILTKHFPHHTSGERLAIAAEIEKETSGDR